MNTNTVEVPRIVKSGVKAAPEPIRKPRRAPVTFVGDESALLEGLKRSEPGAQATFFDAYEPAVRRVLARILGMGDELCDALQECFFRAFRSIDAVEDPKALKSWAMRVAVNVALDQLRQRRRRRWLVLVGSDTWREPSVPTASNELRAVLRATYRVLDRLPDDERVVFALRRIDGMELADVARVCGVSLATVKRRLSRAEDRFFSLARRRPELVEWMNPEDYQ